MIFVAGFSGDVQAVQPDDTGNDVYGALKSIRQHGHRLREIVGGELEKEKDDSHGHHPALDPDIFFAGFHELLCYLRCAFLAQLAD